ncbi:hypothetical protein MUK42_36178 [Musa troglodytarum]|uniref:DUF7866 domain-containing protein n=1 Tax=Musa troglodytarum TaxID=320322 RepID=A0A9E7KZY7_9LILI|nr:hypothetical protein MUK42_36178 [Musa troglodytarum]
MLALLLSVIPYRGIHSNHDEFIPVSSVEHRPLDDVINNLLGHEQCKDCRCCSTRDPSKCKTMRCCHELICLEPGRLCSLKPVSCYCNDCG